MGSSCHYHRSFEGFIVFFIFEGRLGRDIPLNASLEVQELTGTRGRGGRSAALRSDAVTEGGGEGDEVVISLSFHEHELVEGGVEEVGRL